MPVQEIKELSEESIIYSYMRVKYYILYTTTFTRDKKVDTIYTVEWHFGSYVKDVPDVLKMDITKQEYEYLLAKLNKGE